MRLLLDVNNIWVNADEPRIRSARLGRSRSIRPSEEIHLAGFEAQGELLVDTHGSPSPRRVGPLRECIRALAPRPTIVEWDRDFRRSRSSWPRRGEGRAIAMRDALAEIQRDFLDTIYWRRALDAARRLSAQRARESAERARGGLIRCAPPRGRSVLR
jgi:hypothetical protein